MKMDFGLNLVQEQKLIMTQQMQLSVRLLQMSTFELQNYLDKELEENPILETVHDDIEKPMEFESKIDYKELIKYFEFDNYGYQNYDKNEEEISPLNFVTEKKSLKEYLKEQLLYLSENDSILSICEYIIEDLDERGYLCENIENMAVELKVSADIIENALKIVQSLEPSGIGARCLKECLKIQLSRRDILDENLNLILDNYLEYIADNKYNIIGKELGIDIKKAQEYGDVIKSLEPKPSRGFFTGEEIRYVVPDAYIRKFDNDYCVVMNDDSVPKLTINQTYKDIIRDENNKEAFEYVKDRINSAMFLIKSIEHRKTTIYRVLEKIVELQREYFEFGDAYLKPMTLKEISESLNLHESTISRAIKDKYIYTSKGTIRIKDLFTIGLASDIGSEDVSTRIIKKNIKGIIDGEDKRNPLSDQMICEMLNKSGMNISRRTVAKYREEMGIKSSSKRKRF